MFKIALLTLSLTCTPVLAETTMNSKADETAFAALMQKEITNRATARYAIEAILNRDQPQAARQFWSSYQALETLNEEAYAAPTTQLSVEPNRFSAWLKGQSAALYYWLAPKRMIKTMAQATGEYYKELNADAARVPARHKGFYQYVLRQENVQVEAFALADKDDYATASERLGAFVDAQRNNAVRVE
ncbi:hypothetical protein PFWH6_1849 [Pseudomonas fluorescens WH6]|nr:hypothetical protein PFWH6_1849 [Pseudomonas fluorescens WH6]